MAFDGNEKSIQKASDCKTWSDLFKLVINKTKNETRCHTLAFFSEIEEKWNEDKGYGIAKMKPFPLIDNQEVYTLRCYYFKQGTEDLFLGNVEKEITKQKIFLIEFMDYNFKQNLSVDMPIKTSDISIHDMSFGIIIDTL